MSEAVTWQEYRASPLMLQALTHPSCAQKKDGLPFNNQRLEFLGDSVLGLLIAELLYTMYPDAPEGELARRFAALVCGETLVAVALSIGLDQALILSDSEEDNDGRHNPSNLEDACEAMIGALFLDGGYDMARQFVHRHWHELALKLNEPPKDPKTTLQEWAQKQGLPLPEYQVIETHGPSHAPVFTIEVTVEKRGSAQAQAKSKKAAERDAAAALLAQVGL